MKDRDILDKFIEFLRDNYYKELAEVITKGEKALQVDFSLIDKFDPELADLILDKPEDTLKIFEEAVEQIDLPERKKVKIRLFNIPESNRIRIRNIRAEHLGKLICVDGIIKRASEIRPEVAEIVFQCGECGEKIVVLQTEKEKNIVYPVMCDNCKSRRGFKVVEQKLYDARWITIEEPFEITTGERPSDIMVYLKEDLTSPKMHTKTDPGNRIKIVGILKEVPRRTGKGGKTRQMDILIDANNVESTHTEWEELVITPEEEREIKKLAKDPKIYEKLVASLAPSMYGLEMVKLAIILQFFSGVPKVLKDETRIRGDIHILLVGDPAVGKSQLLKLASQMMPRGKYVSGKGVSVDWDDPIIFMEDGIIKTDLIGRLIDRFYKENNVGYVIPTKNIYVPSFDFKTNKIKWSPIKYFFRHRINEQLIKVTLRTGREIRITSSHSVYTIENGSICEKKGDELKPGDFLLIPNKLPVNNNSLHEIDLKKEINKIPYSERKNIFSDGKFLKSKFSKDNIPIKLKVNDQLMRLLGYYIAEGWLHETKESWKIEFELNSKEKDIVKDIKQTVKSLFNSDISVINRKNSVRVSINNKIVFLIFKYVLNVNNYAKSKKIPDIVFNTTKENQLEFIKGYIRGDYGVTTSKMLISDLLYLFLMNETISSFSTKKIKRMIKFPDHKSYVDGEVFELKTPKPKNILNGLYNNSNLHSRVPINLFSLPFITKLKNNGYKRLSQSGINAVLSKNKKILYERLNIMKEGIKKDDIHKKLKISKKATAWYIRKLLEMELIKKVKVGNEIVYKTTHKGNKILTEIDMLISLINSDLGFVEIKEIERIKPTKDYVYDVSVEENENFIAGVGGVLCHNTGAGLTATVVKDEQFLGGWVLEAGALVLANNSLIGIDEFDKMEKTDQIAMHEAMSLQQISIAKASIVATLPARTSVLAGANPKLSRFDPYEPIGDQVEIPETLLSRFDVKFALRDIPSSEVDAKMVDHVLKSRHFGEEEMKPLIPPEFFRKYVAYARMNCKPELTEEAAEKLKEFYVDMRSKSSISGERQAVAITMRQYEALIRLAEASAKVQLRNKVTVDDAQRAIDIMKFSLRQFGFDEKAGIFDIDRAEGGTTSTQRSKIKIVQDLIEELQKNIGGKTIPLNDLVKRAKEEGVDDIDQIIRKMKDEGLIFEPRYGFIQKI